MVGGIYYSKLTKRNMPKHNYVLHIGTRAQCNRFHNGHRKNQTICNRWIFVWIQSDTFCLCGDNKQDILSSWESHLKSVILKPRNPVYTWFLERKVHRELLAALRLGDHEQYRQPTSPPQNMHHSFLYAHLYTYSDKKEYASSF